MKIGEIIVKYLKDNNFDGLYTDECSCTVNDLVPCSGLTEFCKPGVLLTDAESIKFAKESGYDYVIGAREESKLKNYIAACIKSHTLDLTGIISDDGIKAAADDIINEIYRSVLSVDKAVEITNFLDGTPNRMPHDIGMRIVMILRGEGVFNEY